MKKSTFFYLFAVAGLLIAGTANAQMVGSDAYIKGNYVEIGLDGSGGFEGVDQAISPAPAGMHPRSTGTNGFGFVANPQMNGWATSAYDGDFFTPGSPENGWGFEIGTSIDLDSGSNNCGSFAVNGIPGAITSWTYAAPQYLADWEGDYTSATANLHFKINYSLMETDLFYVTTISITNNSTDTIPELYYYRNLDPDNNVTLSGDYSTYNTVLSQPGSGGTYAQVTATQSVPFYSYFSFITDANPGWRAGYGGFSNRDASDLWNGAGSTISFLPLVQTVGVTDTADEAIFIAYKVNNMLPGATEVFKSCSAFDPNVTAQASAAMADMTTGMQNAATDVSAAVYPNPFTDNATLKVGKDIKPVNAELHIYDVLGKEVKNISAISANEIKIDRKGLSGGMYFYKLINENKEIASGKLIIK